jgi:hypothetical protein
MSCVTCHFTPFHIVSQLSEALSAQRAAMQAEAPDKWVDWESALAGMEGWMGVGGWVGGWVACIRCLHRHVCCDTL